MMSLAGSQLANFLLVMHRIDRHCLATQPEWQNLAG